MTEMHSAALPSRNVIRRRRRGLLRRAFGGYGRAVANGRETPVGQPELRAAAPHQGGPLGSSGAAPDAGPAREPESKVVGSPPAAGDKSEKGDKTGETTAKSANT